MHDPPDPARVVSVNVSGPLRDISFAGQIVRTGFFKDPVHGAAYAGRLGLEGDLQGDLTVHGGPEKAIYFYPKEHYLGWQQVLGTADLPMGSFGENVTSEGLLEGDLCIGDVLRIGTATVQVLQPRSPCYKVQIRFGRPDMTALFFRRGRPGWYASVLQEGTFSAHDPVVVAERASDRLSVAEIWKYSAQASADGQTLDRVLHHGLLPPFWKERVRHRAGI